MARIVLVSRCEKRHAFACEGTSRRLLIPSRTFRCAIAGQRAKHVLAAFRFAPSRTWFEAGAQTSRDRQHLFAGQHSEQARQSNDGRCGRVHTDRAIDSAGQYAREHREEVRFHDVGLFDYRQYRLLGDLHV